MKARVKGCSLAFILVCIIVAGFIFCFRSCLSQFDERSALPPILYFETDSHHILFSLVKYSEVNSYERQRAYTSKTVTNHYFIQCNDAATGEKIHSKEITSDIKNFPAKLLGAEGNHAWAFINELMAFDAFTLETVADIKMIEAKNLSLKGMMPKERHYYEFNAEAHGIVFKANDGVQWIIHSNTLIAEPYEQSKKYGNETEAERKLSLLQDRLTTMQQTIFNFNQIKVNQDTLNQEWLGMYSSQELEMLNQQVSLSPQTDQDSRRQFYTAVSDTMSNNSLLIINPKLQASTAGNYYLNGGFLADKRTAKAIHLKNPDSYLIVYKKIIGEEGNIIVSRISKTGATVWELDTNANKWVDYKFTGSSLIIFISDNKEVSYSECTVLMIVDCTNGKVKTYDYFTGSIRK